MGCCALAQFEMPPDRAEARWRGGRGGDVAWWSGGMVESVVDVAVSQRRTYGKVSFFFL
jgi:hypothetical protein